MTHRRSALVGALAATVLLGTVACSTDAAPGPASPPAKSSASAPASAVHWSYEGETGPESWAKLDAAYSACGVGESQSPIDINAPRAADLTNVAFHYQRGRVSLVNNGHTVQVNYDPGNYIELGGVRYEVKQFHHHTPSEHEIGGVSFPAELHIVHADSQGRLAVVALLLQSGPADNAAIAPFIDNLPLEAGKVNDTGVEIDATRLLPTAQTTYRYSGSLTTPPCSEGVEWVVMTTPVELSAAQLDKLKSVFAANNRPVQPINGRQIVEDTTP